MRMLRNVAQQAALKACRTLCMKGQGLQKTPIPEARRTGRPRGPNCIPARRHPAWSSILGRAWTAWPWSECVLCSFLRTLDFDIKSPS